MNGGTVAAMVTALGSVTIAVLTLLSGRSTQRRQTKVEDERRAEQVEREARETRLEIQEEAYNRAKESYRQLITDLESQLARNRTSLRDFQNEIDKMVGQLASERSDNFALRSQLRALQDSVTTLQQENDQLNKIIAVHKRKIAQLEDELRQAGLPVPP